LRTEDFRTWLGTIGPSFHIDLSWDHILGLGGLRDTLANMRASILGFFSWAKGNATSEAVEPPLHDRPPLPSRETLPRVQLPSATAPELPQFAPGYSPIAYNPDEDSPFRPVGGGANPLKGAAAGQGSNTIEAINIIAVGTRKGVYDGLYDFYQAMKTGLLGGGSAAGGAGLIKASYEEGGAGGAGGTAAGGLPDGAGGHVGATIHALRPAALGQGGIGSDFAASARANAAQGPEGAEGTYRPAYKLGDKDLSGSVVNTIAGEASTKNQAAIHAVIDNMMNRVRSEGYGPSGNLEEVARAPGQYTGYRHATAEEAAMIRARIRAIAGGGRTHGSMEYRGAWLYDQFKRRHPEGTGIGGNWFFRTKTPAGPYAAYDQPHYAQAHGQTDTANASAPSIADHIAKHGEALRAIFGHRGHQRTEAMLHDRPAFVTPWKRGNAPEQEVRAEPGSLLRAAKAAGLNGGGKTTVAGEARLRVELASGLKPGGGVKTKGELFKEVRLDRAAGPVVASTVG
jgi:hypothetical protein